MSAETARTRRSRRHGPVGQEVPTPPDIASAMVAGFPDRIVERGTVALVTGLSVPLLIDMVHEGTFPPPVMLTPSLHGWRLSDVMSWIGERQYPPHLAERGWAERRRA